MSHGNGQSLHAEKDCDPSLQKWGNSNCRNLAFNSRKAASGASVQCRASERRRDCEVKAASQRERRRSARNFPFPLEKDRKTREREGERDLHAHAKKTLEESLREREREREGDLNKGQTFQILYFQKPFHKLDNLVHY